jgi:hypothetical protein
MKIALTHVTPMIGPVISRGIPRQPGRCAATGGSGRTATAGALKVGLGAGRSVNSDQFVSGTRGRHLGRAITVLVDVQPAGTHVLTERVKGFLSFTVPDS